MYPAAKFIIDGDGFITQLAAKNLLTDIAVPYEKSYFITPMIPTGTHKTIYSESCLRGVDIVLDLMASTGMCYHQHSPDVMAELDDFERTILVVLGASTRKKMVSVALHRDIPVLDLENGLYPVSTV